MRYTQKNGAGKCLRGVAEDREKNTPPNTLKVKRTVISSFRTTNAAALRIDLQKLEKKRRENLGIKIQR